MKNLVLISLILLVMSVANADAVLHLSGTVPDKGYTIKNGYIIPHAGYTVTVNGVQTTTKVKLTPNLDYTIVVEAL